MVNPRKMPKFKRWTFGSRKSLKPGWRKPQGINSKIRISRKGKVKMPSVSYGAPRSLRYLHPSKFKEVLVHNARDLEKLDSKKEAARIGSSVGLKKRTEITKKAEELKLKVLNPVLKK